MTISSSQFNAIDSTDVLSDLPILASTFADIAENGHCLVKIAQDENLAGAGCSVEGHDHAGNGGARIPLVATQSLGQPASPFINGTDTYVPFVRQPASSVSNQELWRSSLPNPVVLSSSSNTRWRLWLSGDVRTTLGNAHYISFNDGVNLGRYVVKKLEYVGDVNATALSLFEPLVSVPASGTEVIGWAQLGEAYCHLYIPAFARRLTVLMPLAATLSISRDGGESLVSVEAADGDTYSQRIRVNIGSVHGEWVCFYPDARQNLAWRALSIDCSDMADDDIHIVTLEVDYNAAYVESLPSGLKAADACLWLRYPQANPRSQAIAVFT